MTPRQVANLIVQRDDNREPEDNEFLEHLAQQHSDLALLMDLAHEFLQLLRQQQSDDFDNLWMKALT